MESEGREDREGLLSLDDSEGLGGLEGVHHVTAITGDAQVNVDFYVGVLGLRLVKKTVNQDDPTVYHLFYADEEGSAGADITFFEYRGTPRGRAGRGMVHTVVWRVASEAALDFWQSRLEDVVPVVARDEGSLVFLDPEGLRHELVIDERQPLVASHPEIPPEMALRGFAGVRAYTRDLEHSHPFLEALGFEVQGDTARGLEETRLAYEVRGRSRSGLYLLERHGESGYSGAGTVHHVAWGSPPEAHEAWRRRVLSSGGQVTPVIDRFYFKSIYFREPSGVLFEIATLGPGFAVDEDAAHLGERLSLPPRFEALRDEVEATLTPLDNPRQRSRAGSRS